MVRDFKRSRVVLLSPPCSEMEMSKTMCPVCGGSYELGTSELLYCTYHDHVLGVGVCQRCATTPPQDHEERLTYALDNYPWSKPREVILGLD